MSGCLEPNYTEEELGSFTPPSWGELRAQLDEARDVARELRHILKSLQGVITAPALRGIEDTYSWLREEEAP
jgi:hypothetical protein